MSAIVCLEVESCLIVDHLIIFRMDRVAMQLLDC